MLEKEDVNPIRDIKRDHYKKKNSEFCAIYYLSGTLGFGYRECKNIPKFFSYCKRCLDNPLYEEIKILLNEIKKL